MKKCSKVLIFVLVLMMTINLTSCVTKINAKDLMKGINKSQITGKAVDDTFIHGVAEFSVETFKKSFSQDQNTLISPTSLLLALAMTANGAKGETLEQMQTVLCDGVSIDDLNEYLYIFTRSLRKPGLFALNISNSVWYKTGAKINDDFLQKNADYYSADVYESKFDQQMVRDINNWVKKNTDGQIEKIVEQVPEDVLMYLVNTVCFEAEWYNKYTQDQIYDGNFHSDKGTENVQMMSSSEHLYIETETATGFIKPYAHEQYSFAAILPNENITIHDYIQSLTGESFLNMIQNASKEQLTADMPKFSYAYEADLKDVFIAMGMPDAFTGMADFGKMGSDAVFISEVVHKTNITVDETGTKAGAASEAAVRYYSIDLHHVTLDHPFVYAIIDNQTNLPLFIGTVLEIGTTNR